MNLLISERSVQAAKVSLIPDNHDIQRSRQISSNRSRMSSSRHRSKSLRSQNTILNDDKFKSSFEDSRTTLMIFEKYKLIELSRFCIIFGTIILIILEYEYSFRIQINNESDEPIIALLYLILIFTILNILLTLLSYQIFMYYQKDAHLITPRATFTQTSLFWQMIIEILLIIPIPTPFTRSQLIYFQERNSDTQQFYNINEILSFISSFKGFILLNILFKFQDYYTSQISRICRLYSAEFDTHLMLKLCIKDKPFQTISLLFVIGMYVFGFSLEIAEGALYRQDLSNYSGNYFWINLITIFTVGYGDFYPQTDLGRFAMSCSVFYGVVCTSLFTSMFYTMLNPFDGEYMAWALLDKAQITKLITKKSGKIIYKLKTITKLKTLLSPQDQAIQLKAFQLTCQISDVSNLKRIYRDVDGEEFLTMVKRKFREFNLQFEDINNYYKSMKAELLLHLDQSKQFGSPKIIIHKEYSKDDQYFDQLDDTSNDPYLIHFKS